MKLKLSVEVFVDKADFLYFYAKLYHKTNVKTVLIRENWCDKDCDVKYARYMQDYIKLQTTCIDFTEEKIKLALMAMSKTRLNEIYDFLFNEMIRSIRGKKNISDDVYNNIRDRLSLLRNEEDFSFSYIEELRLIEEEIY